MKQPGTGHWLSIAHRAFRDALVFVVAYLTANYVRFTEFWRVDQFILPTVLGAVVLVSVMYVLGLYSIESCRRSNFSVHAITLVLGFFFALVAITLFGYVSVDQRIGRGYLALGCLFSLPLLLINHWFIYHKYRIAPERIAFVAESVEELAEYERMKRLSPAGLHVAGRISVNQVADKSHDWLGRLKHVQSTIRQHKINCVVFADDRMEDPEARTFLRQLRYLGITCSTPITICENYLHYVPLHLVTIKWLMYSESFYRDLYFSKLKRLFDVLTAIILLFVLSPFFLIGIVIVGVFSSDGPVFFTQERVGRFGKKFKIYKLRSMRTDAEKSGPVWSSATSDSRVFLGGAFLRRYRIDEIPQLFNVIRGDMSFVGPRPERPEFVAKLADELPYYDERHMIHPGLTGWAQVCYPYGSSVGDAKCKLEYDLYYLKHASVIFDLLILLDTIRVVLLGGVKRDKIQRYSEEVGLADKPLF